MSTPARKSLAVWVDDATLEVFPGLDHDLSRAQVVVMRSFSRVPAANVVNALNQYDHLALVGGATLEQVVARIEVAVAALRIPIVAVLPPGVEASRLKGPGVVDVLERTARNVVQRIVSMSKVPVVSGPSNPRVPVTRPRESAPPPPHVPTTGAASTVIAVASSTGGAWVLAELLRRISGANASSVVVAQHMEAEFQNFFSKWLEETTNWPVRVVSRPTALEPGAVFVPEGGKDLVVGSHGSIVMSEPASSRFVPSADRLFESVATGLNTRACGVVLSGMGSDGARGLSAILAHGGQGYCQLPSSALIPSMPEAAMNLNKSALAMAPAALPAALLRFSGALR